LFKRSFSLIIADIAAPDASSQ